MADALFPRTVFLPFCLFLTTIGEVYLSTVAQLIALLFALMGSDEQLEALLEQQAAGDVRAEVTASSPKGVGTAAIWGFGVTPQYIYNLSRDADRGGQLGAGQDWFYVEVL